MWTCFSYARNAFVRNLLWTQIEIWLNQRSSYSSTSSNLSNSLSIQKEAKYWNDYDLIWELDKVWTEYERLSILNQYMSVLSNTITAASTFSSNETAQISKFTNVAKECESRINKIKPDFATALNAYDYDLAESIADEIAELRACIAKNEVYIKAHQSYAETSNSLTSLQKKFNYLSNNKEKIAKYYEILKPDLLKELYNISQDMKYL